MTVMNKWKVHAPRTFMLASPFSTPITGQSFLTSRFGDASILSHRILGRSRQLTQGVTPAAKNSNC